MAGMWSLIWSMDRMPQQIISALVETKEGMTRPGQSQRHRPGCTNRVCMQTHTAEVKGQSTQPTKLSHLKTATGVLEKVLPGQSAYLKVLGVTRRGRNGHLFVPENGVDG